MTTPGKQEVTYRCKGWGFRVYGPEAFMKQLAEQARKYEEMLEQLVIQTEPRFVERTIRVKLPMRVLALCESEALHEALWSMVDDARRSGLRGDCELVLRLQRRGGGEER